MLDYQKLAIDSVRKYAESNKLAHQAYVMQICEAFKVNADNLIDKVLSCPITINFHPDRISNNGKTIMENLLQQGRYLSQFHTSVTNGGRSAYMGGDRFMWEQNLFFDSYPPASLERPKYGALNFFRYVDGASVRFGSCFFTLKRGVNSRCTFAYGDSSTNPTTLCTSDTFIGIVAAMFEDVQKNGRLLNQVIAHPQEALAVMLNPCMDVKNIGRNLDYCIETHIHGDVSLEEDIDSFYLDESFNGTVFEDQAKMLCKKYGIRICLIPKRQVASKDIGDVFRGPKIPIIARRIDSIFGNNSGVINAALIGDASRNSVSHPQLWEDIGTEDELFMYFKQLWHTVAYFG